MYRGNTLPRCCVQGRAIQGHPTVQCPHDAYTTQANTRWLRIIIHMDCDVLRNVIIDTAIVFTPTNVVSINKTLYPLLEV